MRGLEVGSRLARRGLSQALRSPSAQQSRLQSRRSFTSIPIVDIGEALALIAFQRLIPPQQGQDDKEMASRAVAGPAECRGPKDSNLPGFEQAGLLQQRTRRRAE